MTKALKFGSYIFITKKCTICFYNKDMGFCFDEIPKNIKPEEMMCFIHLAKQDVVEKYPDLRYAYSNLKTILYHYINHYVQSAVYKSEDFIDINHRIYSNPKLLLKFKNMPIFNYQ